MLLDELNATLDDVLDDELETLWLLDELEIMLLLLTDCAAKLDVDALSVIELVVCVEAELVDVLLLELTLDELLDRELWLLEDSEL